MKKLAADNGNATIPALTTLTTTTKTTTAPAAPSEPLSDCIIKVDVDAINVYYTPEMLRRTFNYSVDLSVSSMADKRQLYILKGIYNHPVLKLPKLYPHVRIGMAKTPVGDLSLFIVLLNEKGKLPALTVIKHVEDYVAFSKGAAASREFFTVKPYLEENKVVRGTIMANEFQGLVKYLTSVLPPFIICAETFGNRLYTTALLGDHETVRAKLITTFPKSIRDEILKILKIDL